MEGEANTFLEQEVGEVVNIPQGLEEEEDHEACHDDSDVSPSSPGHCGTRCCGLLCPDPAGTSGGSPGTYIFTFTEQYNLVLTCIDLGDAS